MDNLKYKQAEYRQNQIGTDFLSCPTDKFTRVFINGEIVSAQNFPQSQLFISYKISVPEGWKTQFRQQFKTKVIELSEQQFEQLNCLESVTHSTSPVFVRDSDGGIVTKFYYCFPIDLEFIMKDGTLQWPIIHFQVLSRDNWDRIKMHGNGFVKVPNAPGSYQLSSDTWKPIVDHKTRVSQYFLGGIIKTKNLQQISKETVLSDMDEPGPINRFNYKAVSSGKVNFRINIATQSKMVKNDERVVFRDQKIAIGTEQKYKQLKAQNLPSSFNTGMIKGSSFTNTRLLN